MPNTPELIFLDAGDVLFYLPQNWARRVRHVLESRGFREGDIVSALAAGEAVEMGDVWISTWEQEIVYQRNRYRAAVSQLPGASDSLVDELFHLCHFVTSFVLFDDVRPTLEMLSARYRLAVISNALPSMDWAFDRFDLRRYFEHVFISSPMGVAKPDPRIFRMALDEVECEADKTVFVDDKPRNVEAANVLGMKGIGLYRGMPLGAGYMTRLSEIDAFLS